MLHKTTKSPINFFSLLSYLRFIGCWYFYSSTERWKILIEYIFWIIKSARKKFLGDFLKEVIYLNLREFFRLWIEMIVKSIFFKITKVKKRFLFLKHFGKVQKQVRHSQNFWF